MGNRRLTEVTKDNIVWFILGWAVGIAMCVVLGVL